MKLSHRVTTLAGSPTAAVSARAAELKARGVDIVAFGMGEPDFDTPDHIKEAATRALRDGYTKYSKPLSGMPAVKQAVCEALGRKDGRRYCPDEVIVTVGCKEAIFLGIMALIDPGDEVLLPVPYWVSYPSQIELAGGTPVLIHGQESNAFKITAEQLAAAITPRTRLLILNYPNNPTGYNFTAEELRTIAEVVVSEHRLWVMSDELYDHLVYGDEGFRSFATVPGAVRERVVTVSSTSKEYAMTGWRVGYAAGPAELIRAMAKLQSHSTSGAATFVQFGMAAALASDPSFVASVREEYRVRRRLMCEGLNALPGVSCVEPAGAFYCFPNVSATYGALGVGGSGEFAARLLEEAGVAVVPGIGFGSDDHVRLSFGTAREQIEEGLSRIDDLLRGR